MNVTIRALDSPEQFAQAEEVQMSAWGMGRAGVSSKEIMIAISDNGGVVLGAFDGRKMVGFALLLVGYVRGRVYMYSHMTGVSKEYQSRGVGYLLKQKQRQVSLDRGFDLIAWTFDPIISKNAHFNFKKLGVVVWNYLVDYYGPMEDSINFGWATDRFLCEWHIAPRRLERFRALERGSLESSHRNSSRRRESGGSDAVHVAIRKGGEEPFSRCLDWSVDVSAKSVLVDIPSDVVRLKSQSLEEARRWRAGTREVFQRYFGAGFTAVALLESGEGFRYLLTKVRMPENFFASSSSSARRPPKPAAQKAPR